MSNSDKLPNSNSKNGIKVINKQNVDTDPNEDFEKLSYEDVQINLRVLGNLKEGQKLMLVSNRYITVDDRYIQGPRRYFSNDSRDRSFEFINHLVSETKRYCEEAVEKINKKESEQINMEKLLNIQALLLNFIEGMSRLSETYSYDNLSRARISTIGDTVRTFCDEDLKKAIRAEKTAR